MDTPKLNRRQRLFVDEYLKDLNATEAAKRAGYSEKTAEQIGYQLLQKTSVKAAVDRAQEERAKRTRISADRVLQELARIATVDIAGAYDAGGNLLPVHEIPEDVRRAIAGIDVFEEYEGFGREREKVGETRKLKLIDKNRALELIGKHLGMFVERIGDPDGKALAGPTIILKIPANGSEAKD